MAIGKVLVGWRGEGEERASFRGISSGCGCCRSDWQIVAAVHRQLTRVFLGTYLHAAESKVALDYMGKLLLFSTSSWREVPQR